jgi:hypothetical protein
MLKLNRQIAIGLGLMFVAAHGLPAQNASAELFGGYSYAKANPLVLLPKQNMNGWVGSAAGYVNRWFGAGLEVAGQFGTLPPPSGVTAPNLTFKEYSYMAGPQFRFFKTDRVQVAGKLLLGGVFGQVNRRPVSRRRLFRLQPDQIRYAGLLPRGCQHHQTDRHPRGTR